MFGLGPTELVIIVLIAALVFGVGRLPELGGAVGKAMREFRKATTELTHEVTSAAQAKPEPPAPTESTAQGSTSEAKPSNQ